MLHKIISGGETGADQAAWRAARTSQVSTGGWMPRGFVTEAGPRPEFAEEFGAVEMSTDSSADRTERNVLDSDATLWFGQTTTSNAHTTVAACCKLGKSCLPIDPHASFEPAHVATWIIERQVRILNVAGNRESDEPGIGDRVERFLGRLFEQLRLIRFGSTRD